MNMFSSSLLCRCLVVSVFFLSGCTLTNVAEPPPDVVDRPSQPTKPSPRYTDANDSGPPVPLSVDHIPEPIPRVEPITSIGNKSPYNVSGVTYHILSSPKGYKAQGVASWYGNKFHGYKTAIGELYNMYGMTAAHKTLPIPCYVRVTHLANKKSVIVRVNDRGPFHGDRLIDLSYTAAKKIGLQAGGTGRVKLEYIDPKTYVPPPSSTTGSSGSRSNEPLAPTPENSAGYEIPDNTYLQLGAFGEKNSALALRTKVRPHTRYPVVIVAPATGVKPIYRVRVGPLKDNYDLMHLRQRLVENDFPNPIVVYD